MTTETNTSAIDSLIERLTLIRDHGSITYRMVGELQAVLDADKAFGPGGRQSVERLKMVAGKVSG